MELWLYDFGMAANARHLTIDSCKTVTLQLKCPSGLSKLESLLVSNVDNLIFYADKMAQNPSKMVFRNISNIPKIPKNTFTQLSTLRRGCTGHTPVPDLQTIKFSAVNIGVIESEAFYNLDGIMEISFVKCIVQKVEFYAFNVNVRLDGKFMIVDSTFGDVEDKAFHIIGRQILASDDDFMELQSGGSNALCLRSDILYQEELDN